jgi:hypothetical protein
MAESPLITELIAEARQKDIITVLTRRFGTMPPEVAARVRRVRREKQLDALIEEAAAATNLAAFERHLPPLPSREKSTRRKRAGGPEAGKSDVTGR